MRSSKSPPHDPVQLLPGEVIRNSIKPIDRSPPPTKGINNVGNKYCFPPPMFYKNNTITYHLTHQSHNPKVRGAYVAQKRFKRKSSSIINSSRNTFDTPATSETTDITFRDSLDRVFCESSGATTNGDALAETETGSALRGRRRVGYPLRRRVDLTASAGKVPGSHDGG